MRAPGTILVVDDRESNRQLLRDMLEGVGHRVVSARDGREAIAVALADRPDIILLDVKMPGMDGFEVCTQLQTLSETATIPVMFVTANYTEEQDVLHGLEIGAYDYLVKPVSRSLLLARVGVMLRIHRSDERVRERSMIDDFTGLFSKNYVVRRLVDELQRPRGRDAAISVTIIDLDDFRICNDTFGHQFGDEVLKRVSATLQANIRLSDSVGRYGGEEFLIVQPETSEREAELLIEGLKDKVAEERFYGEGRELSVTFSAGIAEWDRRMSAEELIRAAEGGLYAAKRAGNNKTVRSSQLNAQNVPLRVGAA
jgi:diguanylate cyclase (GGDEF)-like protein